MNDQAIITQSSTITAQQLERIQRLVTDRLRSKNSKVMYAYAIEQFLTWYQEQSNPGLSKATVQAYKTWLEAPEQNQGKGYSAATINQRLAAIRALAEEATDNGLLDERHLAGISRIKGEKANSQRLGNWLTEKQSIQLIQATDTTTNKGLRDRAILITLTTTGLRRSELASLELGQLQQRAGDWLFVDIMGKGKKMRSVKVPSATYEAIEAWIKAANITEGRLFRSVNKGGAIGEAMSSQAVQDLVKAYADKCGFENLAAHDLRRTSATIAKNNGASTKQIQIQLGHSSEITTERYLKTAQNFHNAPSDTVAQALQEIGLE